MLLKVSGIFFDGLVKHHHHHLYPSKGSFWLFTEQWSFILS